MTVGRSLDRDVDREGGDAGQAAGGTTAARPMSLVYRRIATEMGPLLLFFLANLFYGVLAATAAFMAATVAVSAFTWVRHRRLPALPLVSTALVLLFGGATLLLEDDQFIKMRATLMNGMFSAVLLGSLAVGKPALRLVLGETLDITEAGWRGLTLRLGLYLLVLAIANEVVWRTASTDTWAAYKVFAVMPLNLLFLAAQAPFVRRHRPAAADGHGRPR